MADEAKKKKVEHTYVQVGQQSTNTQELLSKTKKNAMPYRIASIILWIVAIAAEVFAVLFFTQKLGNGSIVIPLVFLGVDLICLVIGSILWKKGNHIDPASEANKIKFWLQNNLGTVVAAFAFIPFIIIALTDKNASKKNKTIACIAAGVALIIGVLCGIDFNPVSQEQMLEEATKYETVYWTKGGEVYHLYNDCGHLNNTEELMTGTAESAIENKKTRVCKNCEKRYNKEHAEETDTEKDVAPTAEVTEETED